MDRQMNDRLFQLLMDRAFLLQDVVLSSGEKSSFYFDGKMVEVCPEGAYLIGEVLFDRIKDLDFNAVGGLAVGAVPLITSLAISCFHHGKQAEGFWVREQAKSHGTKKVIEGRLPENGRVVIVDDVVTSGGSVLKAIEAVKAEGAEVIQVLSIVDREQGGRELLESEGYAYDSVFVKEEFLANA